MLIEQGIIEKTDDIKDKEEVRNEIKNQNTLNQIDNSISNNSVNTVQ